MESELRLFCYFNLFLLLAQAQKQKLFHDVFPKTIFDYSWLKIRRKLEE